MKRVRKVFVIPAVLLLSVFWAWCLIAAQEGTGKLSPVPVSFKQEKAEVMQKTKKLRMPFIANEGQFDERVAFYARTFGGTVFVTKDGEIVYALPAGREEGHQGSNGAEEQGRNAVSGWHGQALLVRAASEFAANGYVPLFRADKASCPPGSCSCKITVSRISPRVAKRHGQTECVQATQ